MDENIEVEEIAELAHADQRMAEARNSAAAYALFWQQLPEDMPEQLRISLLLNWQQSHIGWVAFTMDEDEYE